MKIGDREIGPDEPPFLIADIGANHDGDLDRYLMMVGQAADVGVDAIKPQMFDTRTLISPRGFSELGKQAHQAAWEGDIYDVYQKAETPLEWIAPIADYTHDHGMKFIVTVYSSHLVDAVEEYVDAYKIGSGDITHHELIRYVIAKGKPVVLGTGASTKAEVWDTLFRGVGEDCRRNRLALLQCNTNYQGDPGDTQYANLSVLRDWARTYGCRVGLSDHTPGYLTVCAAVALGACVIEKHFTDDPQRPGPDHSFAMTPFEWRAMVQAANQTWEALGDGIKRVEPNETESRIVQRRALRWRHKLRSGAAVAREDAIPLRPCPPGALEPYRLDEIVGKVLKRDTEVDTLIRWGDFE